MISRPSQATVKRLFAVSGNRCAFPECTNPLVEPESGTVVGEICHIRAQNTNGPRYDEGQTDEARHGFENLILLCPGHHKVVDADPERYTVTWLLGVKAGHEAKYRGGAEPSDEVARRLLFSSYDPAALDAYLEIVGGQCSRMETRPYRQLSELRGTPARLSLLEEEGRPGVYVPLRFDLHPSRSMPEAGLPDEALMEGKAPRGWRPGTCWAGWAIHALAQPATPAPCYPSSWTSPAGGSGWAVMRPRKG